MFRRKRILGKGRLLRDPQRNPPLVRKLLLTIGDEKVTSLQLLRAPLQTSTKILLNVATFGKLQESMDKLGIDKLFHLCLLVNDKYLLEKNEVIRLFPKPRDFDVSKMESLIVPVTNDFTINDMLEKTRVRMGDNYGGYNAKMNNCSVFVGNVLTANNVQTDESWTFLSQETEELFKLFPSLSKTFVDLATQSGAVLSRQLEGEGRGRMRT